MIVASVVKRAKSLDIESLKNEYVKHNNPDVKMSIASGLCATRDTEVAASLIKWGLDEGGTVRSQDIATWFAYLMRNSYTRELAWEWFTNAWDYISQLSGGGKYMDYFVWYTSGPLATDAWLAKFKEFFTPMLDDPALKRNILVALSEIEARSAWRKREAKSLKGYFSQF